MSLAVRWCDADRTVSHCGPEAVNDGLDPESYTEDCLRQDMAAAALIIQVIKQLAAKVAVVPTPRKSAAGSAIADIKKCYLSAVMKPKPDWLVWLEGNLQEAVTTESFASCRGKRQPFHNLCAKAEDDGPGSQGGYKSVQRPSSQSYREKAIRA